MAQSGTSDIAVNAFFSRCSYVGVFHDRYAPMVPMPRGASRYLLIEYAYYGTKRCFFVVSSLAESWSKPM